MSVLVVTEARGGAWHPMSFETLAAGQRMARAARRPLVACVVGSDLGPLAEELAAYEMAEVVCADHSALGRYTPDAYAEALRQMIDQVNPSLVLFPHTYQTRDLAPKLATSLGKPFISDAVAIRFEEGEAVFVRQLFQGKLHADIAAAGKPPHFASLQSGAQRGDAAQRGSSAAPVRRLRIAIDAASIRTRSDTPYQEAADAVDLGAAGIIVSVGRGIQSPDNIPLAEDLARALGGELAASRPICDSGWLPLDRQIGSSGQTVAPDLYLALGISGAIQHVVGMKGAKTIVAVNQDEGAPIFEIADYGVAADLFDIVPALLKALNSRD